MLDNVGQNPSRSQSISHESDSAYLGRATLDGILSKWGCMKNNEHVSFEETRGTLLTSEVNLGILPLLSPAQRRERLQSTCNDVDALFWCMLLLRNKLNANCMELVIVASQIGFALK